jgi:hypothetical protein
MLGGVQGLSSIFAEKLHVKTSFTFTTWQCQYYRPSLTIVPDISEALSGIRKQVNTAIQIESLLF